MSKEQFKMSVEEVEKIALHLSEVSNAFRSNGYGYYNDISSELLYEDCPIHILEPKPIGFKFDYFASDGATVKLSDGSFLEIEISIKKTKHEVLK